MVKKLSAICFAFVVVIFTIQKARAQKVEYVLKSPDEINSVSAFSEGLASTDTYKYDHGYIDTSGKFIINPQFDDAGDFHNGRAWVAREDTATYEKTYGFINEQGDLVIPYQFKEVQAFSSGMAAVKKDSMWFYINKQGETVLDSSYVWKRRYVRRTAEGTSESFKVEPKQFHNGLLAVRKGDNVGYIDTKGHIAIPYAFDYGRDFSDGVAVVNINSSRVQKHTGNSRLDKFYQSLSGDGEVKIEQAIIDTTGKIVGRIDVKMNGVSKFYDGLARFRIEGRSSQSALWGFINKKGKVIIPATYKRKPLPFSDGLAYAQVDGEKSDNTDGYAAIFDTTGTVISKIPFKNGRYTMFDSKLAFHEGLWGVKLSDEQTDTFYWGFMDKHGKLVIPPMYNRISNFSNGRASVYYIDEDGRGHKDVIKNPLKKN